MAQNGRWTSQVYQFKIVLNGIKPLIWRRVQVPETYSFWDLHVAIQDAMGWQDYHLHRFEITNPLTGMKTNIGIPNEKSTSEGDLLPGWKHRISHYFTMANNKAMYLYDYLVDNWNHTLTLEGRFSRGENTHYPVCLEGRRACPPEDCGGVRGYYRLLERIKNHNHEHFNKTLKFTSIAYHPERWNIHEIHFDNPSRRLDLAFNR
jgi:hypothetical protein